MKAPTSEIGDDRRDGLSYSGDGTGGSEVSDVPAAAKGKAAKTRAFTDWIGKRFAPEPPWR
ncbi:hypothetical protein FJ492_18490 [Mesorhizobium sp. B2-5-4]|nr:MULTISPECIES: hypothetical protein [unclassified Mesorhizobium]TPL77907.1 hypothetical protein FJ941_23810 [Mesorhizobium sp. B2-3-13]TPJ37768.1 hypothetical protein FJ432_24350 [Mesorhizobium sp. B2-6-5]TPJ77334.1 hypothetical protein FJ434_25375 [Mesorhizobium sp. B2-5-13]TPK41832.1 hypothetical protein FJ492_18490 [Mesorhizobium sp. B2-5-4]TPK44615.1 hypothetical protein FJ560_22195 [Mesorhizobium sp. B2-5-5]